MNRLPHHLPTIATLAAVVALTASTAYWSLQLFTPQQRQIAVVPVQETPPPPVDAALGLFGGQATVATASTSVLGGVGAARDGRGSVAIIATSGATPQAYPVGKEVAPGVTVQDVQPRSVTLLDGGVQKRLDLLPDAGVSSTTTAPLPPVTRAAPPPASQPSLQPSPTPLVPPPAGTPTGPAGQVAPIHTAPVQRPTTAQ
jgi:general secretion pathway protein C